MRSSDNGQFLELLTEIDPQKLIPVIEKGLEIHKLDLVLDPDSEEIQDSIRYSRAVLTFLYGRRLGL